MIRNQLKIKNHLTDIGKAVRASCSYPVIFSPYEIDNARLIDGGIRENAPWRELKEIGTDKVISVVFKEKFDKECCMNIIDVAARSIGLLSNELSNYEWDGTDYLLEVYTEKIGLLDMDKMFVFHSGNEIWETIKSLRKVQDKRIWLIDRRNIEDKKKDIKLLEVFVPDENFLKFP